MSRELTQEGTVSRRSLLGVGAAGAVLGAVGMAIPAVTVKASASGASSQAVTGPDSAQVGLIYQLQAAFHRAKTTQDIELMMSLWAEGATLNVQGDSNSPYTGGDRLRAFWLGSGSFTHRRFSLVPSYKIQIRVSGDRAWLYFECHDVGDYDLPKRSIAGDTFLAETLRRHAGRWLFADMTAGKASPLSVDHYYFPYAQALGGRTNFGEVH